jgi:hypothetical protein
MYSSPHACHGLCEGRQTCNELLEGITEYLAQGNLYQQQQQEEQQRQKEEWWAGSMAAAATTAAAAKEAMAAALAQAAAARVAAAAAGKVSRRSRAFKKAGLNACAATGPGLGAMFDAPAQQSAADAAAVVATAAEDGGTAAVVATAAEDGGTAAVVATEAEDGGTAAEDGGAAAEDGGAAGAMDLVLVRQLLPAPPLGALTSLQLPALGAASQQLLAAALAACPNLVQLRLSGITGCSWSHAHTTREGLGQLIAAVQRLGELQELTIDLDAAFRAYGEGHLYEASPSSISGMMGGLPAGMEVLQLQGKHHGYSLQLDSMTHLVNLRHLELPDGLVLLGPAADAAAALQQQHGSQEATSQQEELGGPADAPFGEAAARLLVLGTVTAQLAGLTALTSLYCHNALDKKCAALLCLPSLKVLQAGWADGACLAALQPSDEEDGQDAGTAAGGGVQRGATRGLCSQLDTLALGLGRELKSASTKKALGALKHLKALHLSLVSDACVNGHLMHDDGLVKAAAESLGNLPQLQHLELPLPLLLQQDGTWLTALTSMTSLALNSQTVQPGHVLLEKRKWHAARLADQKEKMKVAAKALAEHVPSLKQLQLYNVVQPVSTRAKPAAGVQRLLRAGVALSVVVEEEQ